MRISRCFSRSRRRAPWVKRGSIKEDLAASTTSIGGIKAYRLPKKMRDSSLRWRKWRVITVRWIKRWSNIDRNTDITKRCSKQARQALPISGWIQSFPRSINLSWRRMASTHLGRSSKPVRLMEEARCSCTALRRYWLMKAVTRRLSRILGSLKMPTYKTIWIMITMMA